MSFDMARLLSAVCAFLLSTSSWVASVAFTFSLDTLFVLVLLQFMVVVLVFETGLAAIDAAVGVAVVVVDVTIVVVAADAMLVVVVMVVVAVVMVLLMTFVVLTFDAVSGFGIVVSVLLLLFLRVFLLRSSVSVIWSTISSPHCLSLIGLISNSMPRNRRAIS